MILKSPVSRFGGKYYLTDWLARHIPEHNLYCEPFCGAGHLLFTFTKPPRQVEVINDIDGYLIAFFRVIQHPETRQMLIEKLNYMPYSRSLWNEIRSRWKSGDVPQDEVERVSQWFYLNRTCFSGDQRQGGFACPGVTGRNPVQSFRNAIKDLNTIAERLRNVCIENLDYQECIKRYDSEDTLFYCDPPYMDAEHYYGDSFTEQDHYRLAELLHNVKGKVMLSHYQCDVYDRLYSGWNKYTFESFKGSHKADAGQGKPVTQECLFTNFEARQRSLF